MIGTKIGHLTITRKLGEGGMGAVYLAEHDHIRTRSKAKQLAVKVLLPQWTQQATIVQRFKDEAIAAASIKHRNIISIHDYGQLPEGTWYIVMDYLEGGTLRAFCASQGGPLATHLALEILAQIANGLEAAHAANIVHRDLKGDNIFLIQGDDNPHHPVILDWGIAKLGEHDGGAVTRTGTMAGTPAYMAPEQMRDLRLVDRRSDVYALGVIAYQMVSGGWFPYQLEDGQSYAEMTAAAIYHLQMSTAPVDPRRRFSELPDGWANAVLAAINPDPARRPQSARAFILMLAEATAGDAYLPDGIAIIKEVAKELLQIGNLPETVRAPKPTVPGSHTSHYRLGERLGAGGMAEVFRATQTGAEGFERPVAVKRVLAGFSTVAQFASMFVDEARIASRLSHPNIVSVLNFDRDAEGRLFLAMELVDGRDLASLAATGPLPPSAIIFVISEALRGLGYAHDLPHADGPRGVIHRDVSPQNVLLSWEGAVKVSDFGIAKARDASAATASTLIKGKPRYMSPEQANGERLDGRSDLFAVGVMLWELLACQHLFGGTSRETIAQVMFRPIPRPSTIRASVPGDLEAITLRLLERDPARRFTTAEPAIEALAHCNDAPRNGRSELVRLLAERFPTEVAARTSRPVISGASTATVRDPSSPAAQWQAPTTTLAGSASQTVQRPSVRRSKPIAAAVAATLTIVAIVAIVVVSKTHSEPAAVPSATTSPSETTPTLTIITDPPGARVLIDGVSRGSAPLTERVLRAQHVTIHTEMEGFEPATQVATIASGSQTIVLTLRSVAPSTDGGVMLLDAGGGVTSASIDAAVVPSHAGLITPKPTRPTISKPSGSNATGSSAFNPDEVGGD